MVNYRIKTHEELLATGWKDGPDSEGGVQYWCVIDINRRPYLRSRMIRRAAGKVFDRLPTDGENGERNFIPDPTRPGGWFWYPQMFTVAEESDILMELLA